MSNRKINLFISGPIRPSCDDVIKVISNLKNQFPNSIIFFSTWKSNPENIKIKEFVNYFIETEEPTDEFIYNNITNKTKQQLSQPDLYKWTLSFYKMFYGLKRIFDFINESKIQIGDNELCLRIRSDIIIEFNNGYINTIINNMTNQYFVDNRRNSGVSFDDCFCITDFSNMKKVWYYENIMKLNDDLKLSWNIEDLVKRKVTKENIDILYVDKNYLKNFFVLRNNNLTENLL